MTAAAAEEPPPDPVPVLTRKLQLMAETLPELFTELFNTKEQP